MRVLRGRIAHSYIFIEVEDSFFKKNIIYMQYLVRCFMLGTQLLWTCMLQV